MWASSANSYPLISFSFNILYLQCSAKLNRSNKASAVSSCSQDLWNPLQISRTFSYTCTCMHTDLHIQYFDSDWVLKLTFIQIFWVFFLHSEGEGTHLNLSFPEVPLYNFYPNGWLRTTPNVHSIQTTQKEPKGTPWCSSFEWIRCNLKIWK